MKRQYGLVCLTLLALAAGSRAQDQPSGIPAKESGAMPQKIRDANQLQERDWLGGERDSKGESRVKARYEWFHKLRAFPRAEVPMNAMQNAWLQAQQMPVVTPHGHSSNSSAEARANPVWQFWGPDSDTYNWLARVNAIAVNPTTPSTLYIGEAQGGLWKSTDSGATWTNLTDSLSSQTTGCITLDPTNPNIIYYGTGEPYLTTYSLNGVGIWKSTDGGATWNLYGNSVFGGHRVNHIVIDPTNTNHWIVSSDIGIYTTADAGNTFTQRLAGTASALKIHPTSAATVWAALGWPYGGSNGANNGLYKSTDGGNTWTKQTTSGLPTGSGVGRVELDICKGSPNTIYALFGDANTGSVNSLWKTTNGGASWSPVTTPQTGSGQQSYDLMLRVDPNNPNNVYTGTIEMAYSTNGGGSWGYFYAGAHPDHHSLDFDYTHPTHLYVGNDGGLFYVDFDAGTYAARNTGRGSMEFYGLDVHPTDPNQLLAGAQDNAPHQRTTSNTYIRLDQIGGDGIAAAYDHSNPNVWMVSLFANPTAAVVTTDNGASYALAFQANPMTDATGFVAPMINDPNVGARFYFGTQRVWRSNSDGANGSWSPISGNLSPSGYITTVITVAPSNSNVIYAGCYDGTVSTTSNATAASPTWVNLTHGLPTLAVGGIAVDPSNPATVYVGFSGFGSPHVWKSVNSGGTWTNISGNLPDAPVNSLVVDPTNHNALYAATETSVYVTTNGGTSWAKYGTGLPTIQSMMLRANATTGYLTVCTYGRGCWRIALGGSSSTSTISGNITLQGCTAPAGQVVTLIFRPADGSGSTTQTATLTSSGSFSVAGIPSKNYSVWIKGVNWLAKVVPVDATLGSVSNVNVTLSGGDCNNDNKVDIADFGVIVGAYGSMKSDPTSGYNPNADLTCDGVVDIADFGILVGNYLAVGDL